jgi:hypothetical protein
MFDALQRVCCVLHSVLHHSPRIAIVLVAAAPACAPVSLSAFLSDATRFGTAQVLLTPTMRVAA